MLLYHLRRSFALFTITLLTLARSFGAAPASVPAPPTGTPVDLSTSHDFAAPANITADATTLMPGTCTLQDFRALPDANRFVYSFETWPLAQPKVGGGTFTFPFHLGAAVPTDLNIAFSENGPFPLTNNLMQAEAGDKASSPTHVLGGLGNIGYVGMQNYYVKFDKPVAAFGFVCRSAQDFNFQFSYFPGSPKNGYGISYVLTDGSVVNLGPNAGPSGPFKANTNYFVGVIDKSGRGIVSLQFHVKGTAKTSNQEMTIDDMSFETLPVTAVAPIISLRSSHDFREPPAIASAPASAQEAFASLSDFRFIVGSNRYVYDFTTWLQEADALGSGTADFQFDFKGKGAANQKLTVTATSSDGKESLTKIKVPMGSAAQAALGGLGDIGNGGWAQQTFKFDKPVWAFGVTLFSPNEVNLSKPNEVPVAYTLSDGTVMKVGSAGVSSGVVSGGGKTFVGIIDKTGKGIASVTLSEQGTATASQPVYLGDIGFAMPGPPPGDWKMTLDEEFNGNALDPKTWVTGYHFSNIINNEMQAYTPDAVTVANGVCTIKVEKRDAPNTDMTGYKGPVMHYASGAITTMGKWTQTYGYWEARVKMTSGPGTWPAFWLLTDRGSQVKNIYDRLGYQDKGMGRGAEIDIFEFMPWWKTKDDLFYAHSGIIWSYGKNTPTDPPPHSHGSYALANDGYGPPEYLYPKADSEFHTYGLYWAPEDLIFYIDSKPVYRVHDPKHVPNTPCYVLFNVALAQNMWGKGPMKRNPTPAEIDAGMPNTMQIDYFRAYSGTIDP